MPDEKIDIKKELLHFLLLKVKEKELAPEIVKQFLKEINKAADTPKKQEEQKSDDIAIIGISCRFPDADCPEEFWDNLVSGKVSIGTFPEQRREDYERVGQKTKGTLKGGYLESVDKFDPEYFNIPPAVALNMDPYHRIMLEIFVEAIEEAGYCRSQIKGSNMGVFVGNDHSHRLMNSYLSYLSNTDFTAIMGSWTGVLASRIAYLFNLTGPALVVDSGCSSSLLALDHAVKALKEGDCETALVGGINLLFYPTGINEETQSPDSVVRAFDQEANGTVWSEGAASILLKPLDKAIKDKDHIHGVIKGIATNNDGKTNGLTAPSAKAQYDVIIKAWERAKILPETISYIETHGTGTRLGDPIEVKGLTDAFRKYTNKQQFCGIGSVKTNIGHTVGVSGLASIIKVLLCMENKMLPASKNFKVPNPYINFINSPVYVVDHLMQWESNGHSRRAGVSGFSLAGTNCHVVLEEAPEPTKVSTNRPEVYVLSGRTIDLLKEDAYKQLNSIIRQPHVSIGDRCFTAATGREHYKYRAAIICDDLKGLKAGLKTLISLLQGDKVEEASQGIQLQGIFKVLISQDNEVKEVVSKQVIDECIDGLLDKLSSNYLEKLNKLASYYINGADINFVRLYQKEEVYRCSMPAETFMNNRYWDETKTHITEVEEETYESDFFNKESLIKEFEKAKPRLVAEDHKQDELTLFVAWLWSETLGYEEIKLEDDFYMLGGDSINGIKILQILNCVCEVDVPYSLILTSTVFKDFVEVLRTQYGLKEILNKKDEVKSELVNINKYEKDIVVPLTSSQKSMLLSSSIMKTSVAYNITGIIKNEEQQTIEEVENIVRELIARHQSLRTSFHFENGNMVQRIHPKVEFNAESYYYKNLLDDEVRQQAIEKFVRPFDLEKAPLIRVGYLYDEEISYIVLDMHHIISDGTSMGVLIEEYLAKSNHKRLAPLSYQYVDAVKWINEQVSKQAYATHREWWLNQFRDEIPVLNLYTDRPRKKGNTYKGSRFFRIVPNELYKKVKLLAQATKTTPFTVLIGALYIALAKLSGEQEVVIGTPTAGRARLEMQKLIGMFVNTLAIPMKIDMEKSFLAFLEILKNQVIDAFDHAEFTYENLVDELNLERINGRNPLFDVYFVFQNVDLGLGKDTSRLVPFDSHTAKFDLTIIAREVEEGLLMEWEYSQMLYDHETVERIADRYETLLGEMIKDTQVSLKELEIMNASEKMQLVDVWNRLSTDYPGDKGIAKLFEEYAEQTPNKIALRMENKELTFKELNEKANQVARIIVKNGIRANEPVALLFERSFEMIIAILGTLKAGGYYIALDPENPKERLMGFLRQTNVHIVLTHGNLEELIKDDSNTALNIVHVNQIDEDMDKENLSISTSGDNFAYMIYTSGSTGKPKGVLVRQRSVIRVVKDTNYVSLTPNDIFLELSSYCFDGSVYDIFGALLNGATLVIAPKEVVMDITKLANYIRDYKVTTFFITAALFNALVDYDINCLRDTRKVLFGGEAASAYHVKKAFEVLGPNRLINGYGPTETTVFAVTYVVDCLPTGDTIPIGTGISNTTLYIFNNDMKLQPIDVPGELYIGGAGVAAGYFANEALTKERFIENPYKPGEVLYKTGDLVVRRSNGLIYYLGRLDNQVKLRGFRIELGEIEAAVLRQDNIKEAYVNIYTDEQNHKNLCLWFVPDSNTQEVNQKLLKDALSNVLPAYMIPNFMVPIEKMPLNRNGKINRKLLPDPIISHEDIISARNEKEACLEKVWSEVLGISNISMDDNFFALGGDSIKAIQIIAKLQQFNNIISVTDIFEYQTIEKLAEKLEDQSKIVKVTAEQGEISGKCEMSTIQQWFLKDEINRNKRFTQAMMISNDEYFNKQQIESALEKLCAHHDMLRVAATEGEGLYIRKINEGNFYEVREATENLKREELERYLIKAQESIDLFGGPLIVAVTGLGDNRKQIFIAIHHIAVDVVSWHIILEDLISLLKDGNTKLPMKTTAFTDWISLMKEWIKAGNLKEDLAYWRNLSRKVSEKDIASSDRRYCQKDRKVISCWIAGEEATALKEQVHRAYHTKVVHILLSILTKAISEWLGKSSILVNMEGHGREIFDESIDIVRTVGWFTSTFPVLFELAGETGENIKRVKESVNGVPRNGIGFELLKRFDQTLSIDDRMLLEQVKPEFSFNYIGKQEGINKDGIGVQSVGSVITVDETYESSWLLDIVAYEENSKFCVEINYPIPLFEDSIDSLLDLIRKHTTEVISHCLHCKGEERTASDFDVTKIEQDELEDIFDDLMIE